jgi:pyruvate/2-oxoglutarate dehydrogenase complex dihydrolipoamide acyltransferase (E2) component
MLLSQRAYAKHRSVNLSAVQKAIKSGRITATRGKIDAAQADTDWDANTDPKQQRGKHAAGQPQRQAAPQPRQPARAEEVPPLQKSREVEAYYSAKRAKLDYRKRAAELVEVADMEREVGNMITSFRGRLLVLPGELAEKMAVEADPVTCREMLETGIYEALSELAQYEARNR